MTVSAILTRMVLARRKLGDVARRVPHGSKMFGNFLKAPRGISKTMSAILIRTVLAHKRLEDAMRRLPEGSKMLEDCLKTSREIAENGERHSN